MDVEEHIQDLKQRVAKLERQLAFFMQTFDIAYEDNADETPPQVAEFIAAGQKKEAIRAYQDITGVTLKVAKEFVEARM